MADAETIAQWMVERIDGAGEPGTLVLQSDLAAEIAAEHGPEWTFTNAAGHVSIERRVLVRFRALHGGRIRWDRERFGWFVAGPDDVAEENHAD